MLACLGQVIISISTSITVHYRNIMIRAVETYKGLQGLSLPHLT